MKNLSRKVLVLGAVAFGLSAVVPAHAMDSMRSGASSMAAQVQNLASQGKEVVTKQLSNAARQVNKSVSNLVKCAKTGDCSRGQKVVLTSAVAALVVAATAMALAGRVPRSMEEAKLYPAAAKIGAERAYGRASKYVGESRLGQAASGAYGSAAQRTSAFKQRMTPGARIGQGITEGI